MARSKKTTMRHEFSEVVNDRIDCFLVGDLLLLKRYKETRRLSDNIAFEFVLKQTNAPGDASQVDLGYSFAIDASLDPAN